MDPVLGDDVIDLGLDVSVSLIKERLSMATIVAGLYRPVPMASVSSALEADRCLSISAWGTVQVRQIDPVGQVEAVNSVGRQCYNNGLESDVQG